MTTIDARTPMRPPAPDTRPYWERYKQASHFRSKEEEFDAVKIGIWLFLTTEVLLFAGLFCAYVIFRMLYPEAFQNGSWVAVRPASQPPESVVARDGSGSG